MTSTQMQLIRKLRSPDNKVVVQAVEELRARGWLSSGTLQGMGLRCANLQRVDLHKANLQGADLRMADLRGADLSEANLEGARLNRAKLRRADLSATSLKGADLFNTDLDGARNLADAQLAQVGRLRAAELPYGGRYDGRFNLPGDLEDACSLHINVSNAAEMADFYGVPLEDYMRGQEWAQENLAQIEAGAEAPDVADTQTQLVRKLRSHDNKIVMEAVEELRAREWHSSATLRGAGLQRAQLEGANLSLSNLAGADLSEANLHKADLSVANLQAANLSKANLQQASLQWAGLQKAKLEGTNLRGANLAGAILEGACLIKADLQEAEFHVTNLQGADLFEANLMGARNLCDEELAKAYRLSGAVMPDGSTYDGRFNLAGDA